jgi:hypothetical protein
MQPILEALKVEQLAIWEKELVSLKHKGGGTEQYFAALAGGNQNPGLMASWV